jgi:hypothetical protein
LKREQTNPNLYEKLPHQLKKEYRKSRKNSPVIENLKIAAALKLWEDRGFRDIKFDVPIAYGGKTLFIKVLAKHQDGTTFGVECTSNTRPSYLKKRLPTLQTCLPKDSYIVAVFPETAGEKADKAVTMADEVWVTGKNGKINQMMFHSYLGKE